MSAPVLTEKEASGDRLQERIAARTQEVASKGQRVSSWLAVEIGQQHYLVPLSHASEIFPYTSIQPVPYARPWFLGVANLRGQLVGVTDVEQLMGRPAAGFHEQVQGESKLLTFNPVLEINAALAVNRVVGLKSIHDFVQAQRPQPSEFPWLGNTYRDRAGRQWQEINLQKLAQSQAFLSISQ
ncbi:twitching motility protein PilI [Lampropedia hyalina DSM 16112]|jgi:twitching motility protein PilI|uniref:Twitching motility protein PilI n=1 Tax=Lampropedia hyalina DSM 16112 TaxID=1122156 RepID=A0A1M5BLH4_9BURK|nr:chemotaxis protein CheW [Lampropedia hyalina]SHF43062.1 twitching motility protein PilI [Lampropedia hyalina DSM 16112]